MLVDYGSDDSGDESTPPELNKSTSPSLPSSHASGSGSSGLTLPAPKVKRAPKKIAIDLPALPKDDSVNHESDGAPLAKKPRTETRGTGSSALFSRLPAPKSVAPVKATPERVLGSGNGPGLVFNNPPPQMVRNTFRTPSNVDTQSGLDGTEEEHSVSVPFMPVSVMKGKANVSLEESFSKGKASAPDASPPAAVDLFSLSTSYYLTIHVSGKHVYPDSTKSSSASITNSKGIAGSLSISSAPKIDEYVPPEPTPDDPYPGYYQLPSGNWASYDPTYYQQFYNKWKADYDREVRALETKAKGFEKADADDTQEINALHEMEKAKKEIHDREEKKALTQGAGGEPEAPRMNVKVRSLRWSVRALYAKWDAGFQDQQRCSKTWPVGQFAR